MTFDVNDTAADIDGIPRELLPWEQIDDAAPSIAIAAGEDAA
jgi:hypothetical protein